ncbi:TPA: hypothetical protein ACTUYC_002999, partial [Legionella anisa]
LRRDDSLLNITVNYRIGFLVKFCEELSGLDRGVQCFSENLLDPADKPRDVGIDLDWFFSDV